MENALVLASEEQAYLPVMRVTTALARRAAIVDFGKQLMVEGVDYGTIPGVQKPSLLKPGAEKLCTYFGMAPQFVEVETVEDWTGAEHGGEAFFMYRYRCDLYRMGVLVGSGIGSCNSWESKYRYRNAERVCPECGQPTIMRSKFPPKGQPKADPGWYCYAKKGGCGVEFGAADPRIVDQKLGKVANPDPADQVNTIDKMAQKRALVAATLIAVNASEFFTQDVEDMAVDGSYTVVLEGSAARNGGATQEEAKAVASAPAALKVEGASRTQGARTAAPVIGGSGAAVSLPWQKWTTVEELFTFAVENKHFDTLDAARVKFAEFIKTFSGYKTSTKAQVHEAWWALYKDPVEDDDTDDDNPFKDEAEDVEFMKVPA